MTVFLDGQSEWKVVPMDGENCGKIRVSNPLVPIPNGLETLPSFMSPDEAMSLLDSLDGDAWMIEGFAIRRKVQRFSLQGEHSTDSAIAKTVSEIARRFVATTGRRPQHVSIEEYPCTAPRSPELCTERVVTTFESRSQEIDDDAYFVAQLPISAPLVQHLNCPQRRVPDCWTLESPNHWTDLWMEPYSLYVKSKECLWKWRSRIASPSSCTADDRALMLKFYTLPPNDDAATNSRQTSSTRSSSNEVDALVHESVGKLSLRRTGPMPPLENVLTIVVTTSPIKSHPSTELLERTFDSFRHAGVGFAYKCRKVIVCDGCRVREEHKESKVTRKHTNAKQALRNGIATRKQSENYEQFKQNLRALCNSTPENSPFANTTVEELETRCGYGFALRHALRHCVKTPYVCVIQHDRTFMRQTPVAETLEAMWKRSEKIKYVGMSMRSNLPYLDIFLTKYGKKSQKEVSDMVLRPPELELDSSLYGPEGSSSNEVHAQVSESVRKSIDQLALNYQGCWQCILQEEWVKTNPPAVGKHQLTLTPTLFWYDNTHICETAHYRDFVFDPNLRMVARGGFVEDKLSPAIVKSVERFGLAAGHARFGCYLLDDHCGRFFTGHLDGGSYFTQEQRNQVGSK